MITSLLADVSVTTGLGEYTALVSMGVVGIIGGLLIVVVTILIPRDRKAERETQEKISTSHDVALSTLGATLSQAVKESGTLFATTLREYREEQAKRDEAERHSRDAMLRSSDEKVDRLANSFQELAITLGEVMHSLSVPSHSGILRKRRDTTRQKESVLE